MNKFKLLFIILFTVNSARCESRWSSEVDIDNIIIQDRDFRNEVSVKYPQFFEELVKFRSAVLRKDLNHLYSIRTDLYKKTVALDYFLTKLMKNEKLPSEVYFSLVNLETNKDKINIKVFYVMKDADITYCNESKDEWRYENQTMEWKFIGNQVSWGSPIVIE